MSVLDNDYLAAFPPVAGEARKAGLITKGGASQLPAPKGDWPQGEIPPIPSRFGTAQSAFRYCVKCGEAGHGRRLCFTVQVAGRKAHRAERLMSRKSLWGLARTDAIERTLPGFTATLQGGSIAMSRPADSDTAKRSVESVASAQWRETRRDWRRRGII